MASTPVPPPPVEEEGEEIVVTGKRLPKQREYDPGTGGDPGTDTPGDGGGSGGGEHGGDGGYYEVPVEPLETPCVSAAPDGASLHDINRQALRVTNTIEGLDVERVEYGALLYTLGGQAYTTPIFTQGLAEEVSPTTTTMGNIPTGANIVGFVHNHTSIGASGDAGAIPSSKDYEFFNGLRSYMQSNVGRNITVDRNALLYINGRERTMSNEERKTRVYDNTDENRTTPECSLQ